METFTYLLVLLSLTTTQALDCESLCGELEEGEEVTGDCCSSSYCVCSPQHEELTCDGGQFFCPQLGVCLDFYGMECDGETFDCCHVMTTPTPATTTTTSHTTGSTSTTQPLDCQALCLNTTPGGTAGHCCAASYCLCSPEGAQQVTCQNGHSFCPSFNTCMDMYGNTCRDTLFDCCLE